MAITYWDPYTSSSTSTTTWGSDWWGSGWCDSSTTTGGSYYYYVRIVREVLVEAPASWGKECHEEFLRLINLETNTGWKITMVITGDILVIDPNVEKRTLKDFIPLLKENASKEDLVKIEEFFIDYPIE